MTWRGTTLRTVAAATAIVGGLILFILVPLFRQNHRYAERVACKEHLKILSKALLLYSQDWDDVLPPANKWLDCISGPKYIGKVVNAGDPPVEPEVQRCPAVPEFGYAINAAVAGRSVHTDSLYVVLLFETDKLVRNAAGTQADVAKTRHSELNCAFLSGEVKSLNQYWTDQCVWTPKQTKQ